MSSMSTSEVMIRQFQPGDEGAFRRLNEEWITRYFRLEEKDRELLGKPQKILDGGGRILLAVCGDKVIGCCALIAMSDGEFEVSKMAVTASHQGKGIGRVLLSNVIKQARELGARRLYLETNSNLHPAIGLYESLGFRHMAGDEITRSPYERADVYMELLLR